MLYINITLLGISAIYAIFYPDKIQSLARYSSNEVLIVDWGIYAFTLVLLMLFDNLKIALLFCYVISTYWNYKMYKNKEINPDNKFFFIAQIFNILGLLEILYYLRIDYKNRFKD